MPTPPTTPPYPPESSCSSETGRERKRKKAEKGRGPYSFYAKVVRDGAEDDIEVTSMLANSIREHGISTEEVVSLTYQPLAIMQKRRRGRGAPTESTRHRWTTHPDESGFRGFIPRRCKWWRVVEQPQYLLDEGFNTHYFGARWNYSQHGSICRRRGYTEGY